MVNGEFSEYQRHNTLRTTPEIGQRFNSEVQEEQSINHLNWFPYD